MVTCPSFSTLNDARMVWNLGRGSLAKKREESGKKKQKIANYSVCRLHLRGRKGGREEDLHFHETKSLLQRRMNVF